MNDANQITSISNASPAPAWVTPVYDAGGNMTTTPEPGNEGTAVGCVYDAWNRLVSATVGGTTVNYAYDGQGRMIDRTQGDVTTHYYYVGQQVIETRAGLSSAAPQSLEPQYQYVWSPIDIDAPILRDVYNSSGEIVPNGRIYYLTDANDNVTGATNASGVVQERYFYDAYGKVTVCSANWTPTGQPSSVNNTLLYTGQQQDPATGLYNYRARWYNPSTGSFMSPDSTQSDANLYRYCDNGPVSRVDPSGEDWEYEILNRVGPGSVPDKFRTYAIPGKLNITFKFTAKQDKSALGSLLGAIANILLKCEEAGDYTNAMNLIKMAINNATTVRLVDAFVTSCTVTQDWHVFYQADDNAASGSESINSTTVTVSKTVNFTGTGHGIDASGVGLFEDTFLNLCVPPIENAINQVENPSDDDLLRLLGDQNPAGQ